VKVIEAIWRAVPPVFRRPNWSTGTRAAPGDWVELGGGFGPGVRMMRDGVGVRVGDAVGVRVCVAVRVGVGVSTAPMTVTAPTIPAQPVPQFPVPQEWKVQWNR
jgi:hypothetical protein